MKEALMHSHFKQVTRCPYLYRCTLSALYFEMTFITLKFPAVKTNFLYSYKLPIKNRVGNYFSTINILLLESSLYMCIFYGIV